MPNSFTHYWGGDSLHANPEGEPLDHTAGEQFVKRGVKRGDGVYVVNVTKGQLLLVGRLTVGEILFSQEEAVRRFGPNLWEASERLVASPGSAAPISFSRFVPADVVMRLQFETAKGTECPKFKSETELDQQTMRGVRKLTTASARLLDTFFDPVGLDVDLADIDLMESAAEGRRKLEQHLRRERDDRLVKHKKEQVLAATGRLACEACSFDFEDVYGALGAGFCEVHHRKPLKGTGETETSLEDLAVLCSNCHRAIHRSNLTLSVESLAARIEAVHRSKTNGDAQ